MKLECNNFFEVRKIKRKTVASFKNIQNLSVQNSKAIKLGLMDTVTTKNSEIEIDFHGIKLIDSSVLDTLNLLSRLAKRYNSKIYLTHISDELMDLIELARYHAVFDIRILKEDNIAKEAA